jgi:hypothetical protein
MQWQMPDGFSGTNAGAVPIYFVATHQYPSRAKEVEGLCLRSDET